MSIFNREKCTKCKDMTCVDRCVSGCLSKKDGVLQIDHSMCWGCGLCARACPVRAVTMKEVRKPDHIPKTGGKLFSIGPPDK
jgi:Fe-S-cluster-containing hydrogenase component 2